MALLSVALATLMLAVAGGARAEELRLSISDAFRRAAGSSDEVDAARAALARSRAEQRQAESDWYPQITATGSYTRTLQSEYDDLFEQAGGAFEDLPFGRDNIWRFGVTARQNLFRGGRTLATTRGARAGRRQARLGVTSARAQAVLEVTETYYDALLAERRLEIARQTLAHAQDTLDQAETAFAEGELSEYDVLRARVSVESQRPVLVQRASERELAHLRLKHQLRISATRTLVLTTRLTPSAPRALPEPVQQTERATVRQAEQAVRAAEAAVDAAESQHYPSVDLFTDYGRVAYPTDLFPTWDQFRTNWTAGVSVSVPLFQGFRIQAEVGAAQASLQEARARLRQARRSAQLDTAQAHAALRTARAALRASGAAVLQARRAHRLAVLRYREGVSTQLEVNDARLALEQAELAQAQAARDLEVARVRVALLPNLPLAAALPTSVPAPVPRAPPAERALPGMSGMPGSTP